MKHAAAVCVGLLVILSGCALPPGSPEKPPAVVDYRIAAPDVLEISVLPEPAIAREVTVRPDGRISMDLIGDVDVEGRTIAEVRAEITRRMSEYIVRPDVTVVLARSNSRRIYVFGEVRITGAYPIIGNIDARGALGLAGGPTRFSKLSTSRLVRQEAAGQRVYQVNLEAITLYGDGRTNYELQPGDVLYVPPNAFARVGYAIGVVLFPLQQVLGFGADAYGQASGRGRPN